MMHTIRSLHKLHLGIAGWLLAFSLLALAGLVVAHPSKVSADNCDPVNIVLCGLDTRSLQSEINSFQADYQHNSNNGHSDLKQVYRWAGATDASVGNMSTGNTKAGTLFRNGDIKVDGQVVGHDSWVAARFTEGAGFVKVSDDAWARKTTTSFAESSAPVIVHFSGGTADFAVMVNCANAVKFTPPPPPPSPPQPPAPSPQLVCDNLNAKEVGNTLEFAFHAKASASHTTITKYVFDFGDQSQPMKFVTSASTVDVQHTYPDFGQTFHARVTVFSNDFPNGKTSADCTALAVTPQKAALKCVGVVPTFTSDPLTVKLTATALPTRTTITSYTFNYSDGTQRVIPTNQTSITDTHTFAQNNVNYQVSVAVAGKTAEGHNIDAATCMANFTTPGPNECKPGVPAGSPDCNVQPCQFDASLSSTDDNCVQPTTELLNTGPGNIIGVAAGVSLLGTAARLYYLRRKLWL